MLAHGMARPTASTDAKKRDVQGPFTVVIEGVAEPATFTHLSAAVEAVWRSMRELPLGWYQYDAYREFLGPGGVERVQRFLERDGSLTLSFVVGGESHALRFMLGAKEDQSESRKSRHDGTRSATDSR